MSEWKPAFSQGKDGDPVRCFDSLGDETHVVVYVKVGKEANFKDQRRVVGLGRDRADAHADAMRAISRYDSSPTIVNARKRRV